MSGYLNLPGNEPGNLSVNLHQDTFEWALQKTYDFARLMYGPSKSSCPYYRDGDEYKVVRHQM